MAAVFTIMQGETDFLPIWHSHYSKHFRQDEIYVLNHLLPTPINESQASLKESWDILVSKHSKDHGYHLVNLDHDCSFDHNWLCNTVRSFQRDLLKDNDWVLFAEADEILLPDPEKYPDLKSLAQDKLKTNPVVVADGYEVVHQVDVEPDIDFGQGLLAQREWWYSSNLYSKPLLSRIPLSWCMGFHACDEVGLPCYTKDKDLVLIHLHKMDWKSCLRRHLSNAERKWANDSMGYQNRITAESRLRQWWDLSIDERTMPANLIRIPDKYRRAI